MAQRNPSEPSTRKLQRQLESSNVEATIGGAIMEPNDEPAWTTPIAVDRSFGAKRSATARAAVGNPPPSPKPNRNRAVMNPPKPLASACPAHEMDHQTIIRRNPTRTPR